MGEVTGFSPRGDCRDGRRNNRRGTDQLSTVAEKYGPMNTVTILRWVHRQRAHKPLRHFRHSRHGTLVAYIATRHGTFLSEKFLAEATGSKP